MIRSCALLKPGCDTSGRIRHSERDVARTTSVVGITAFQLLIAP